MNFCARPWTVWLRAGGKNDGCRREQIAHEAEKVANGESKTVAVCASRSGGFAGSQTDQQMKRPNILWIVTTQWRAQALGYTGDPNARTPCLDALAAESVNFTQAVTPHPFAPFARAALLTGVSSPENGVRDYFDPLPTGTRTIAHEMERRGYATAFFGKWGVGKRDPSVPLVGEVHAKTVVPTAARGGFGFWEGFEGGFLLNDPWLHGSRLAEPAKFTGYQSDVVVGRADGWLRERERGRQGAGGGSKKNWQPWFCVVSLEAPHPPYDAPAAGIAARHAREIVLAANVPRGGAVESRARRELAGYYAHLEATDRSVGRLVAEVDARATAGGGEVGGERDDSMIVFTSMHGDMHGAHGLFRKGWPYEESVRVPLLVRGAGGRGLVSSELVSLVDLGALTLAWADGRKPEAQNEQLKARMQRISMPSVVALPQQCDRAWHGMRTMARKLVLNTDGSPWLFFDLERDPMERDNCVGDPERAGEIAELRARASFAE